MPLPNECIHFVLGLRLHYARNFTYYSFMPNFSPIILLCLIKLFEQNLAQITACRLQVTPMHSVYACAL